MARRPHRRRLPVDRHGHPSGRGGGPFGHGGRPRRAGGAGTHSESPGFPLVLPRPQRRRWWEWGIAWSASASASNTPLQGWRRRGWPTDASGVFSGRGRGRHRRFPARWVAAPCGLRPPRGRTCGTPRSDPDAERARLRTIAACSTTCRSCVPTSRLRPWSAGAVPTGGRYREGRGPVSEVRHAQPRGLSVLRALRGDAPRGGVPLVRGRGHRRAAVLRPMRIGPRRHHPPQRAFRRGGRRAQAGHGAVRRRGGLHLARRADRSRSRGPACRHRVSRVGRDRRRSRRHRRQVHGRLPHGGLRCPPRARRRCRARRRRGDGHAPPRW